MVLLLPWRPWSTRERIAGHAAAPPHPLAREVTVLIPARNEAESIATTLTAVASQGDLAQIILIDDQSEDGTGDLARGLGLANLLIIPGSSPPPGWSGKLWALEQGYRQVNSDYVLLLDADIALQPGVLNTLLSKMTEEQRDLVSVMASLHMETFWERLLLPPFIYFFKLIYPFELANSARSRVAAAAGGCMLLKTHKLQQLGGFSVLRNALIDDCTLARHVKDSGGKAWLGLSRDVIAIRPYGSLENIWNMVARTAYTQLRYSVALLAICTLLLILSFVVPVAGGIFGAPSTKIVCYVALLAMMASYTPVLRYYGRRPLWAVTLPVAATLYLAMTWTSAIRYMRGERSRWKNRVYER